MEKIFNFQDQLLSGIEQLAQAIRQVYWDQIKHDGLSPIQFQILRHVSRSNGTPTTIGMLAQRFDLSYATISDSVKTLNNKGLIEKTQDKNDRRVLTVKLTQNGRSYLEGTQEWDRKLIRSLQELNPEASSDFYANVVKLISGMQKQGLLTGSRNCLSCRYKTELNGSNNPPKSYCSKLNLDLPENEIRLDCNQHNPIVQLNGYYRFETS